MHRAAERYATIGFQYHRASALYHLAAAEYALGAEAAGDRALAEALAFGSAHGYLNFAWWHPERMRILLYRAMQAGIAAEYSARLLSERGLEPSSGANTITIIPGPPVAFARLVLNCLGGFNVWIDGVPLPQERWRGHTAGPVRMQRLLLYLARHRAPQPPRGSGGALLAGVR